MPILLIVPSIGIGEQKVVPAEHTPPGIEVPSTFERGTGANIWKSIDMPGWNRNIPGAGGPTKIANPPEHAHSHIAYILPPKLIIGETD